MPDIFDVMERTSADRLLLLRDGRSGLQAVIALDDVTLGPALGGIRTRAYSGIEAAIADAQRLAAAMTLKTAIAGLPAGGGKTVILDHPGLDRPAAFRRLGRFIEDLGGLYRAAGDLGTTTEDLLSAASETAFVNTRGQALGDATGRGVVACIEAIAQARGANLSELSVAIQGCGLIGAGVARQLKLRGASLIVSDLDRAVAERLAAEVGADLIAPEDVLTAKVDIVSPCAIGGVISASLVSNLAAWGICGGANNQLDRPETARVTADRGIIFVPDFLSSAGAVVAGAAEAIMGGIDAGPLIDKLGDTAREVLEEADTTGETMLEVAARLARARIGESARAA